MIRKLDGWNVVLAGLWNRAIFTPEWVGRVLLHQPEVETLISIMPYLPIIYRNEQVAMEVSTPRIVFRPRRLDTATLQAAEGMAHTVLDKLKDTPLMGVGVNFAFVEDNPGPELVELFGFGDNATLAASGWGIQERRLVRRVRRENDTLNLTLIFDGQNVTIEFNFHTETADNETSRNAVNQRIVGLRDAALHLLNDVYHLQLIEEDEDHG